MGFSWGWQAREVGGQGFDGFAANTADHELASFFSGNEAGHPQFLEVKRDGRAKLVAPGDVAADFAYGRPLDLTDFSSFFDRHGATALTQELEDRSPGRVTQCPEHRGDVELAHGVMIPLYIEMRRYEWRSALVQSGSASGRSSRRGTASHPVGLTSNSNWTWYTEVDALRTFLGLDEPVTMGFRTLGVSNPR